MGCFSDIIQTKQLINSSYHFSWWTFLTFYPLFSLYTFGSSVTLKATTVKFRTSFFFFFLNITLSQLKSIFSHSKWCHAFVVHWLFLLCCPFLQEVLPPAQCPPVSDTTSVRICYKPQPKHTTLYPFVSSFTMHPAISQVITIVCIYTFLLLSRSQICCKSYF